MKKCILLLSVFMFLEDIQATIGQLNLRHDPAPLPVSLWKGKFRNLINKLTAYDDGEGLAKFIDPVNHNFPIKLSKNDLIKIHNIYFFDNDVKKGIYRCPYDVMVALYRSSNSEEFYSVFPFLKPESGVGIKSTMEILETLKQTEFMDFLNTLEPGTLCTDSDDNHQKFKKYINSENNKFPIKLSIKDLIRIRRAYFDDDIGENVSARWRYSPGVLLAVHNSSNQNEFREAFPFITPEFVIAMKTSANFELIINSLLKTNFVNFIYMLEPGIMITNQAKHQKFKKFITKGINKFPIMLSLEDLKQISRAYFDIDKGSMYSPSVIQATYNSSNKEEFYAAFPFLKPQSGIGLKTYEEYANEMLSMSSSDFINKCKTNTD